MPVATDNKNKEGRIRYRIQPIVNILSLQIYFIGGYELFLHRIQTGPIIVYPSIIQSLKV